jgi:hypothetical protein
MTMIWKVQGGGRYDSAYIQKISEDHDFLSKT